ncbi:hypothetical protein KEJ51_03035 [Candidatus Bathyarchaeota archaeon]|nr:hypothetical protein [Candidatus Bathyarchaeota archaeon]MBS7628804.1 hypothetical protein [Candidatus Bathyarchaeota archaeon]
MSTAPPYGQQRFATLDKQVTFTLQPHLASNLTVEGSVNYRLYLRSQDKVTAHLNISLFEVKASGYVLRVSSAMISLPVEEQIGQYVIGIPIRHSFSPGSTITFSIASRDDEKPIILFWDAERTDTYVSLPIGGGFITITLQAMDMNEVPVSGADISIFINNVRVWMGRTGRMGFAEVVLPKYANGSAEIILSLKGVIINRTRQFNLEGTNIQLRCKVYSLQVEVLDILGSPVEEANVLILRNGSVIGKEKTSEKGNVKFPQLPESVYSIEVNYELAILAFTIPLAEKTLYDLSSNENVKIRLPLLSPWILNSGIVTLILIAAIPTIIYIRKRKRRIVEYDFSYFDVISGGGISPSSTVMISGPPGSGKSVLTNHLLMSSLKNGNPCLFITNVEFPSNIRRELETFEPRITEYEKASRLIFIDSYSALGGQESTEEYSISSIEDLTGLGVKISACLDRLGRNTDVFLDSLTPIFAILKGGYITNFVHSIGAKTKGLNGRFFYTLGTNVKREELNMVESVSDCIIEMSISDKEDENRRRLRIKKMKKKHIESWIDFRIDGDRGLIFRVKGGGKMLR